MEYGLQWLICWAIYLSARMTDGKRAPHRGNFDGAAAWGNDLDSNPDGTLEALRLVQCTGGGDSFRS